MKKTLLIASLLLSLVLTGCGGADPRIDALEEQVALLQEQVTLLQEQIEGIELPDMDISYTHEPMATLLVLSTLYGEQTITVEEALAYVSTVPDGISGAELALYHNGALLERKAVELYPGEGSDSFEAEIGDLTFEFPALTEGDQLELVLEVTLPDGTGLTAEGCAWDYSGGQLLSIAG